MTNTKNKKMLVHLHLYYYDQTDYFISKLRNIVNCDWDLIVTVVEKNEIELNKLIKFKKNVKIVEVDNIGYDILPFLQVVQNISLEQYDYVLKLHTKRKFNKEEFIGGSSYKTNAYEWRNSLVNSLIASKKRFNHNLEILANNKYGFICNENYLYNVRQAELQDIVNLNKIKKLLSITNTYDAFIAGTMFMIKADALMLLKNICLKELDFQKGISKPSGGSGTMAHAFERLFAILAFEKGYEIYTIKANEDSIMHCIRKIFSIENHYVHKVVTIFGIKFKFKSKKLLKRYGIDKNSFFENIFSVKNHYIHKVITILGIRFKFKSHSLFYKIQHNILNNELNYYKTFIENKTTSKHFIKYDKNNINNTSRTKLIAFYLPQFHTFKENEEWHGKGFTEWTNVTKAFPMYEGHSQPQLPIDVGFYDLSTTKVMYRQVELAKNYGIHGFCFHYYWFSGKRLMETPIFNYLNDKNLDLPFCLCWANENWSKRWDGGNNEVLMEQSLQEDDGVKFANDIAQFLRDERYIKVDNKPLLVIYRPDLFEHDLFLRFVDSVRSKLRNLGTGEVHLVMAKTFGDKNPPSYYNLDAAVEFPPHGMNNTKTTTMNKSVNPHFKGMIWDMEDYINNKKYLYDADYTLYKTVFPSWDNTARRDYESNIFATSPELYKKWLQGCIEYALQKNDKQNQLVFINAWNEWAEGAHLEPDRRNGYAYLQATRDALEEANIMENL